MSPSRLKTKHGRAEGHLGSFFSHLRSRKEQPMDPFVGHLKDAADSLEKARKHLVQAANTPELYDPLQEIYQEAEAIASILEFITTVIKEHNEEDSA